MMVTNALADFVPFDAAGAKDAFYNSDNQEEKADLAYKIYRHHLYRGEADYNFAASWFMKALENQSPDALVFTYNLTDPNDKTVNQPAHHRTPIQPYLNKTLRVMHYADDLKSRVGYLALAAKKKHPVACQMSSLAIKSAGTYKENPSLLMALQANGMEISQAQSLELQAIALIKGDRIINNNYSQMIAKKEAATEEDLERIKMLKILGLDASVALGRDFRTISALGGHDGASSICFNGLMKNTPDVVEAFERVGIEVDKRIKCSLGYQVRRDVAHYDEVLAHFSRADMSIYRYSSEQMMHLHDHAVEILQQRVTPAMRHDLLAPGIFHHKVA